MLARVCFGWIFVPLLMLGAGATALAQRPGPGADPRSVPADSGAEYHGVIVTPPLPKPRFILTDTSGARYDFAAQTEGYITLLFFFGYTNCPDICPMHMSYLGRALKKLPKDLTQRFKVVFVTTDPDRDDARTVRAWLDHFGTGFIGLTGNSAEIRAAQNAANVPLAKGAPSYDHAAFVLAYTKDNLAHVIYPSGISESEWLQDLPLLTKETWKNR